MKLRLFTGEEIHDPSAFTNQNATSTSTIKSTDSHYLGQYIPLHYHHNMLQDEYRVGAFREAIQACVKPGMTVLELGGGTGILSYLAACKGAKVTCVERNPQLVACARKFLKANGMDELVKVVAADARQFVPDEPVDVVVCEMLHVALLREKQLDVIDAFKQNYREIVSKKLPRFIPEASLLMLQPVEQSYDFSGYWAPVPLFHAPGDNRSRTQELGALTTYATIQYGEPFAKSFHWCGELPIQESGQLTALRFVTQNALAIDVAAQRATNWPNQCLVLPIDEPIAVEQGMALEVDFQYIAGDAIEVLAESMRIRVAGDERSLFEAA